jgi:acyl-lipid omega-6 desaturase (Delta-12 desaturase)
MTRSRPFRPSCLDAPDVTTTAHGTQVRPIDRATAQRLARHCTMFRDAQDWRALTQLATTLLPFLAVCAALLWSALNGYWFGLVLSLPAGGLLVRLFIFQHDCGHGSFFTSRVANTAVGRALSVLTLTPYGYWRRAHALHHASAGDLSRRGIGDVTTLTVQEYRELPRRRRLAYRIYRNPLLLHLIGPPLYFILFQRSPFGQALPAAEAWRSVLGLNAVLIATYGGLISVFGAGAVVAALLPTACIASWVGGWLFFVQHQFEHTHWENGEEWEFHTAALGGSSHYVLPPLLRWFTGNVGLHHIHHLNSRIPNYRLQECLKGDPTLHDISRLTFAQSVHCIGLALWDEESRRLVSFRQAHRRACGEGPSTARSSGTPSGSTPASS